MYLSKILGLILLASSYASAGTFFTGESIVDDPTLAYSGSYTADTRNIDRLSAQVIYSSAAISPLTFDDGRKSTATLTVVSVSTTVLSGKRLAIAGYVLDEGTHWTRTAYASATAKNISDAIIARTGLNALVTSSYTVAGIVFTTSTAIGSNTNYALYSSTPAALAWSASEMTHGDDTGVHPATTYGGSSDTIKFTTPHAVSTGFPMYLQTVAGTVPTGLTAGTTYYTIKVDDMTTKLALSSTGAVAGLAVNITAITGSGSFKLHPTAFAGSYSFKWQVSQDGSSFSDLAVSSVTYAAPGNTLWDFGAWNYRKVRLNFLSGTGGGINIRAILSGIKD